MSPRRPESEAGGQVFAFHDDQFVYHPNDQNLSAFWQHNPGIVLDVNRGAGNSMRIEVGACGRDAWLAVVGPPSFLTR